MKVLIVNCNRNRQPVSVLPLGACQVAQATEQAGHSVRMLDMMFEKTPLDALEKELKQFTPDVVGLSVRNIDNNDMVNPLIFFNDLSAMIDLVENHTRAQVVLGGAAVGIMPEQFLRTIGASWALVGNGEILFPRFLQSLERHQRPDRLPGLAWIENNRFVFTSPQVSPANDHCHVPDFPRWIDLPKYLSGLSTIPVQSKRGCPFECVYCTYPVSNGAYSYLYSPDSVVQTVLQLVTCGYRDIEFVDDVFNAPYEHALAICEGLSRIRPTAKLQTLELNPLFIDDALLSAMERAGFVGVGVTPESAADAVLSGLGKGFTCDHVVKSAQCIRRHKLPCMWIFMLGGPGETDETVNRTFDFAAEHIRPNDVAFFNIGVRIYPGTKLEKIARREGLLARPVEEMMSPIFYVSTDMDLNRTRQKMHDAMIAHPNFINSESLGLPLVPLIYRIAYHLGIRQPIWKHTRVLRRTLRLLGMDV